MEGLARRRAADCKRLVYLANDPGKIGWGGRIRTFTIHINSVVSYRLDHAPAVFVADNGRTNEAGSAQSSRSRAFF